MRFPEPQDHCPCCGQALPQSAREFFVSLEEGVIRYRGRVVTVGGHLTVMAYVLRRHYPSLVSEETFLAALYGGTGGPEGNSRVVPVYLARLRKIGRMLGFSIATVWGEGWRLVL